MKSVIPNPSVFNRQRKLKLETRDLRSFLCRLSGRLDLKGGFAVVLVSDAVMRRMNRRFAGHDYATDVLSFPTSEEDRAVEPYLGDIFISVETAQKQGLGAVQEELKVLSLHGLLHLLGYDHEADRGEMSELEACLTREMGLLSA